MSGGIGADVYIVDHSGDVVTESAGEGTDEVRTSLGAYTLAANVENLVGTSAAGQTLTGNGLANTITGNAGNDVLDGGAGDDVLDGGAGADTLVGGLGNDLFLVEDLGDAVSENAGEGTDEVQTSLAAYALGANVENLTGTSASGQALTGNSLANAITAGNGSDVLDGGAGADTMAGGLGDDVYYVDDIGDVVTENAGGGTDEVRTTRATYNLAAEVETLTGLSATDQTLNGNALDNRITGNAGDDTLDGRGGNDTMAGGTGNDTYVVAQAGDVVIENAGEGTDEVQTGRLVYALGAHVENLTGTSASGQTLTGNALGNTITGNAGDDLLNGGAGADSMIGGAGNDTYIVDNAGDTVVEGAAGGIDTVRTRSDFTLGDNVENLSVLGTVGLTGTGNALDNWMRGASGDDVLSGLGGNDSLMGAGGADTLLGGDGNDALGGGGGQDTLDGGMGDDTLGGDGGNDLLIGGGGNDTMQGDDGNDRLRGGAGHDTLDGGSGRDYFLGGTGADTFVFGDGDTSATRNLADHIADFTSAQGDRIDLSAMDADTALAGDQAFAFIGSAAFGNVAGELHYVHAGGFTYVEGDTDGDGLADFSIRLDGTLALSAGDYVL